MRSMKHTIGIIAVFVCLYERSDAGDDLSDVAQRALLANATTINSGINLRWEELSSSSFPQEEVDRLGGESAPVLDIPFRVVAFNWQNGRFYQRAIQIAFTAEKASRQIPLEGERCFDGEYFYCGNIENRDPKRGEPSLSVISRSLWEKEDGDDRRAFHSNYFQFAGFDFHRTAVTISQPPTSMLVAELNKAGAVSQVSDRLVGSAKCVAVAVTNAQSTTHFVLDPAIGYAVRVMEERPNKSLKMVTRNSDFVKLNESNTWLPKSSVREYFKGDEIAPFARTTIRADEINNVKKDVARFALNYSKPGTRVSTSKIDGAEKAPDGYISYKIPADASALDSVIAKALRTQVQAIPWFRYSALTLIVSAFVALWYVRRRKASGESQS